MDLQILTKKIRSKVEYDSLISFTIGNYCPWDVTGSKIALANIIWSNDGENEFYKWDL